MNRILLLGAGFSRNWNGRLATEMRAELQTILKANAPILSLLQNHDFETVVAMVQADFDRSPSGETTERLRLVQEAVNAVFKRMNEMFAKTATLEFGSDVAFMIQKWLARFDAIFTLNQDLLLELHYHSNDPGVFAGTRWHPHGWYMPGVREVRAPDAFLEFRRCPLDVAPERRAYRPAKRAAIFQAARFKQLGDTGRRAPTHHRDG